MSLTDPFATIEPPCTQCELLEELPVAYLEMDQNGTITRANRVSRTVHPHEQGSLIGKKIWDLMPADERNISHDAFFSMLNAQSNPEPVRRSIYTNRGEYRTYEIHRNLIRDTSGRAIGMRTVSFDVTEAQIAHEETHESRMWLESVLEAVGDAVVVTDSLGFIRYLNPAAETLSGWKADELVGKVLEKAFPILHYVCSEEGATSHRFVLDRRTRGMATILNRYRHEMLVEISTSPILDRNKGYTIGVVSILRRSEDMQPISADRSDVL